MIFDLWDMETHNLIGAYESELSALEVVNGALRENSPDLVTAIALVCEDENGDSRTIAFGAALTDRAKSVAV